MRTYIGQIEVVENENRISEAAIAFDMQKAGAELLGITLEEYQDFERDMLETNTIDYTPEEIMAMYIEYCAEYDIPCEQFNDYACYDRMGW